MPWDARDRKEQREGLHSEGGGFGGLSILRQGVCLRGSRVGDDRARLSLHDRFHFHLRRRIERGHPAGKTQERRKYEGSTSCARKLVTALGEWRYLPNAEPSKASASILRSG